MKPSREWPTKLAFYIDVDDLDTYGSRIRAAGGRILIEKLAVPNMGESTLFEDPDGRVLGLWKQAPRHD
jgi:predicted enzyme related to lactoylglutathione lyase